MRIQRANLDGSRIETLVETGRGADDRWDARTGAFGIALDVKGNRMYVTDLGGSVYSAKLDGSGRQTLLTGQGTLTGIATPRW